MPEEKQVNHRVILGKQQSDWITGTIPHEVRNPSAVWTAYAPPGEW